MMRKLCVGGFFAILTLVAVTPTRAGLVVEIGSSTITAGGNGSVEVDVINAGSSAVAINDYAIQLVIAPMNGTLTQLAFSSPTPQQLGYLSDPDYIFVNNSIAALPPPFVGGPAQTIYSNDTFIATDSTADGNTVSIGVGQTYLLAILPITTLTQLDPQTGDSFKLDLAPISGTGSNSGDASTYFDVLNSNNNETSSIPFASTSGTVMISAASIPEPGSIVSGLAAVLIGTSVFVGRRFCR